MLFGGVVVVASVRKSTPTGFSRQISGFINSECHQTSAALEWLGSPPPLKSFDSAGRLQWVYLLSVCVKIQLLFDSLPKKSQI